MAMEYVSPFSGQVQRAFIYLIADVQIVSSVTGFELY